MEMAIGKIPGLPFLWLLQAEKCAEFETPNLGTLSPFFFFFVNHVAPHEYSSFVFLLIIDGVLH
jgi:hypothetical protein